VFAEHGNLTCDGGGLAQDVMIGDAVDQDAEQHQICIPLSVRSLLDGVDLAVDFNRKLERRTIEVDDVAGDHVLPTEAPASDAPTAKHLPQSLFGGRRRSAKPSRKMHLRLGRAAFRKWTLVHITSSPHAHPSA
jgi:hypothetical protein